MFKILNNADPLSAAPDTQVTARGLGKLIEWALRPTFGYYDPEFTGDSFWRTVRVRCPHCKPHHRKATEIDWPAHLRLHDESIKVDYYGYFAAEPAQLETGVVVCPRCKKSVQLTNQRGVRTLWSPIATTEQDQSRPVIQENKIWEVVEG